MERLSVISLRASERRQELDSDTTLAVVEQVDPNNLGKVFTITAVTRKMVGECHRQAHAFLVVLTLGEEVKPFARDIARGCDLWHQI